MNGRFTRREMLVSLGSTVLGIFAGCALSTARRRCQPIISGTLWWLDSESASWSVSQWRDELSEQRKLGFNHLWLVGAPAFLDHPNDPLRMILDLCAKRKVQVILDTGASPNWFCPFEPEKEIVLCSENIRRIGARFRGHPAFYAWYIPHEIYVAWGEFGEGIDKLYPALVEQCKRYAEVPVTLSPFFILDKEKIFGDFRYAAPEEYQKYWTRLIRRAGFDIIMLQDSGEHFSYVTNEMRRPFFMAMAQACQQAGATLWGNVETAEFDCPSKQEFVRLYGKVHPNSVKNAPWRPVPIERLREKLYLASEFAERIVTWGYKEYCRPACGLAGRKWYEDYRGYIMQQGVRS